MDLAYHHTPKGNHTGYAEGPNNGPNEKPGDKPGKRPSESLNPVAKEADTDAPGVLFLSGFHSTMQGNKALALEQFCQQHGVQYTRFDYTGHGESPGDIETGNIEQWRNDALEILDNVCSGPQILVSSSMGAWLATLVTLERPRRVSALLSIAAAPDFTHRLLEPKLTEGQKQMLKDGQTLALNSHYDEQNPHRFQQGLLDSGKRLSVLNRSLPITCPIRLLHGTADTDVPFTLSIELLEAVQSEEAQLTLIKGADHRFSSHAQLQLINHHLAQMLKLNP